ncbi:adenylate cyclase type 2 [Erpetoichthys calabaricus]|uniref:adenylate cyclase type 2 n=1 Tax=Erpetoichthys calabaricus TaxID=27687 RepID=UPI0022340A3B|nr:adenylate cyclase type 2 [Erpetoichthys calabaricus]
MAFGGKFSKINHERLKEDNKPAKKEVEPGRDRETIGCCLGVNRTVRRILAACIFSLAALLGAASLDLKSSLNSWTNTEAALQELLSCRTQIFVHIIDQLQLDRSACKSGNCDKASSDACLQMSKHLITGIKQICEKGEQQIHGNECTVETYEKCKDEVNEIIDGLNNTWNEKQQAGATFTVAISKLLDLWEEPQSDLTTLRFNSDWADVLSVRILIKVKEALFMSHSSETSRHWQQTLSNLNFAILVSSNLQNCWEENVNLSHFLSLYQEVPIVPPVASILESNFCSNLEICINWLNATQNCLLEKGKKSLKNKSRDILSVISLKICLLTIASLIYPIMLLSFKQMTEWIQNYARSLKERTEDLKRERRLAEDLLHQMLPKSVAKQLRKHKHVQAESYEQVTIFFSDIVGFTSISATCSPLQVVEMLNNLYMCFDTRIDSYDVYKVETIGDAYMVVSGLPERNGDKHAHEIAKMSLDLVAAVRQVPIPHMPAKRLQLRAGIHTGPCVAGIVGYKMPRYCLFGDTVNTASRMESTSLPQKVHVSSATFVALIKDDAYELQLRGEIEVKGKGKMKTYWLIGHKDYSVQNDSLVCHWNPSKSRKKKLENSSLTSFEQSNTSVNLQSSSERTTPASLQLSGAQSEHEILRTTGIPVTPLTHQQTNSASVTTYMVIDECGCSREDTCQNMLTGNGDYPNKFENQAACKESLLPGSLETN